METSWFSVQLEARAPEGVAQALDEGAVGKLTDLLVGYHGVVSGGAGQWRVTMDLEEPGPVRAAAVAAALVESLAATAGLPDWPMVRVAAIRKDVLEENNSGEAGAG